MAEFQDGSLPDTTPPNRGYDNKLDGTALTLDLMKIDDTIVKHIIDYIKPTVNDGGVQTPVPLVFATPERWFTIQTDGVLRKENSEIIETPLIVVRRTDMRRGPLDKPVNKYLEYVWGSRWNKQNTYDRFAAVNRVNPSRELKTVIIPDYVELTYQLIIWTRYQSHMNGLIEQLNSEDREYWGPRNDFKFRLTFGTFTANSDLPAEGNRAIRISTTLSVQAYLIPQHVLQNYKPTSTNSRQYTSKKSVIIVEAE